jgi:hypothetical protein
MELTWYGKSLKSNHSLVIKKVIKTFQVEVKVQPRPSKRVLPPSIQRTRRRARFLIREDQDSCIPYWQRAIILQNRKRKADRFENARNKAEKALDDFLVYRKQIHCQKAARRKQKLQAHLSHILNVHISAAEQKKSEAVREEILLLCKDRQEAAEARFNRSQPHIETKEKLRN